MLDTQPSKAQITAASSGVSGSKVSDAIDPRASAEDGEDMSKRQESSCLDQAIPAT